MKIFILLVFVLIVVARVFIITLATYLIFNYIFSPIFELPKISLWIALIVSIAIQFLTNIFINK
jgi:hypothetical protein